MRVNRIFQALLRFSEVQDFQELLYHNSPQYVVDKFLKIRSLATIQTIITSFEVDKFNVDVDADLEKVIFITNLMPGPVVWHHPVDGWKLLCHTDVDIDDNFTVTFGGEIDEYDEEILSEPNHMLYDGTIIDGNCNYCFGEKGKWARRANNFEYNMVASEWAANDSLVLEVICPIKKYEEIILFYPQRKKIKRNDSFIH